MIISVETALKALLILSVITSLSTEGVKKILNEQKVKYSANLIAVLVSAVCSILVAIIYCTINHIAFSFTIVVLTIALIWISFILATCGYDKVKMLIEQLFSK